MFSCHLYDGPLTNQPQASRLDIVLLSISYLTALLDPALMQQQGDQVSGYTSCSWVVRSNDKCLLTPWTVGCIIGRRSVLVYCTRPRFRSFSLALSVGALIIDLAAVVLSSPRSYFIGFCSSARRCRCFVRVMEPMIPVPRRLAGFSAAVGK